MIIAFVSRALLLCLAVVGVIAGLKLSIVHAGTGETCPMIGPIPACYVVTIGYAFVWLAAFFKNSTWSKKLFFLGWSPIAILAGIGVVLELSGQDVCPVGALQIPQCFYSLFMALLCLLLYLVSLKLSSKARPSAGGKYD